MGRLGRVCVGATKGLKLLGSKYGLVVEVGGVGDHGNTPEGGVG